MATKDLMKLMRSFTTIFNARRRSLHKVTTKSGLTTLLKKTYLDKYESRKAFKFDEQGYEWHKYGEVFKVLGSKLTLIMGALHGVSHAKDSMPCNWDATLSMDTPMIVRKPQFSTSAEAIWLIQWDV